MARLVTAIETAATFYCNGYMVDAYGLEERGMVRLIAGNDIEFVVDGNTYVTLDSEGMVDVVDEDGDTLWFAFYMSRPMTMEDL